MSTRFLNRLYESNSTLLELISIKNIGLLVSKAYPNVVEEECVNKKQSVELIIVSNGDEIISSTTPSYSPVASESLSG